MSNRRPFPSLVTAAGTSLAGTDRPADVADTAGPVIAKMPPDRETRIAPNAVPRRKDIAANLKAHAWHPVIFENGNPAPSHLMPIVGSAGRGAVLAEENPLLDGFRNHQAVLCEETR